MRNEMQLIIPNYVVYGNKDHCFHSFTVQLETILRTWKTLQNHGRGKTMMPLSITKTFVIQLHVCLYIYTFVSINETHINIFLLAFCQYFMHTLACC